MRAETTEKFRKSRSKMSARLKKRIISKSSRQGYKNNRRIELIKIALDLVSKILKYSVLFVASEFVVFAYFEKFDAIIGLLLGTLAMTIGIVSIALSYENYGIISFGKLKIPRMYFLRYAFYAATFLISVLVSDEKLWGILGTFLGMLNFKIVIFSFGWRWGQ